MAESLLNYIGWSSSPVTPCAELPDIFPFPIAQSLFVDIDVQIIFTRILTDAIERTQGLTEKSQLVLWDNCLKSEKAEGLVTLIAKAMSKREDLFLVYVPAIDLVRRAEQVEEKKIRDDYAKSNRSDTGIYISFREFQKTQMIRLYSALEYLTVASLHKSMNLSKAMQLKFSDLRKSVGAFDKDKVVEQAKAIALHLSNGRDVALDALDKIETTNPDLTAAKTSIDFIAQKMSLYIGMPASYITGLTTSTMSDTGEADAKAVERGLKNYFHSIIKPVCQALFDIKSLSFKSEDFYGLNTALEVAKTFDLVSEEYLSNENKTLIINKAFGLPSESKGDKVIAPPNPGLNNEQG